MMLVLNFDNFQNFAPYKYKQAWIILNFYTDTKNSTSPKGLLISPHDFHFHKNDFISPIQVTYLYQQVDIISSQIWDKQCLHINTVNLSIFFKKAYMHYSYVLLIFTGEVLLLLLVLSLVTNPLKWVIFHNYVYCKWNDKV